MSLAAILATALCLADGPAPRFEAEQIFPPNDRQTHAPGIAECANGDLIASWYGDPDDGKGAEGGWISGARRKKGESGWSKPFLLADRPSFPDGNTALWIDPKERLWLFWPTIIGSSWESSLMNYKVSSRYQDGLAPEWDREGLILIRPEDFKDEALKILGNRDIRPPRGSFAIPGGQKAKLADPLYQRLGWAPRCKPTLLPSGRIVLPLYSDTFAISIMALSDDEGKTWFASKPLLGFGNIQPTVLRKSDGTLVAYMRENGPKQRIRVSTSKDDGITWSPVTETDLPNPGAGIDAVRLKNGHWLLVFNDDVASRARLAVAISEDEGKTWPHRRFLENHGAGRYHYPAVIEGRDGTVHAIYSTFISPEPKPGQPKGKDIFIAKGIKHAAFNEAWVKEGDKK